MSGEAQRQLAEGLEAMGIDLTATAQGQLLAYAALLEKWNKTYSLTALRGAEKAVSHHLLDSLAVLPYVPAGALLDVGSGGGMPGIPLAIACPELAVTLLDSNSKKTAFLRQATIELKLKNVSVHCGRVEQYHPTVPFTAITSRAFAELSDFVSLSRHLLANEGVWLALKGLWPHAEIAALPAGVRVQQVCSLAVPGIEGERHVIILEKDGVNRLAPITAGGG